MAKKGYSPQILERAGLVIPREGGRGFYDRFRGRIIFPIYNIEGDVIGFGGRILDDSLPKYLNSPETILYSKGENLYALDKAKDHIRKEGFLILVEGYMDAIALHQSGIQNTAATLGTAITDGHLRAIKRFTKKVVIVFDADPAGKKAASMGLETLIEGGMEVEVASLPKGDDPDSFIIREGRDRFLDIIHTAQNLIDFSLSQVLTQDLRLKTLEMGERIREFDDALSIISKIPNRIERGYRIKRLAEESGIDEGFFIEELKRLKSPKKVHGSGSMVQGSQIRPKAEEILIHIMLKEKDLAIEILNTLSIDDFTYPAFRTIAGAVENSIRRFDEVIPERILGPDHDQEVSNILSELSIKEMEYEDVRKAMEDCLIHINRIKKKRMLSELQQRIKEAEMRGEEVEILALLSEKQRLAKAGP